MKEIEEVEIVFSNSIGISGIFNTGGYLVKHYVEKSLPENKKIISKNNIRTSTLKNSMSKSARGKKHKV
jgi:hypothetical protein